MCVLYVYMTATCTCTVGYRNVCAHGHVYVLRGILLLCTDVHVYKP